MKTLIIEEPTYEKLPWAEMAAIRNQLRDWDPVSAEHMKSWADTEPDHVKKIYFLFRDEDRLLGYVQVLPQFWLQRPGLYLLAANSPDPEVYRTVIERAEASAQEEGATAVGVWMYSHLESHLDVLQERGYDETMKLYFSQLDLTDFVHSRADQPAMVVSVGEYQRANPETWLHDYWRMEMDILRDVPMPGEFKEDTLEEFERYLQVPTFDPELNWLALIDGQLAGSTSLQPNLVDPTVMTTGLTGVLREYRRLGVAWQLKVHSALAARERGVRYVYTDNEMNNPMFTLNERLGFQRFRDMHYFERSLA